jgi:hypothetical protein
VRERAPEIAPTRTKTRAIPNPSQKICGIAAARLPEGGEESPPAWQSRPQTIVAIAIPTIQDDLTLSATGVQWIINGYLLSLSALFAFGGRLADIAGHRRMVVLGAVIFATASALCGATPTGSLDETWLIIFRVIQGAGAAIMFPAALAPCS